MMHFKQPIADTYSMFFRKRKFAVSFIMLKSTPRKNYTEILEH